MPRSWCFSVLVILTACKVYDPLYCDEDRPCTDPDRSFCDIAGDYPASEGIGKTCIPTPLDDAGPGDRSDAGSDGTGDGGVDRFVVDLAIGIGRSCAIFNDGGLRCWGNNENGLLGYAEDILAVGDDEHPFEPGDIPTGGAVKQVALAENFSCVRYGEGNVRCFGNNSTGLLGYGHTRPAGELAVQDDVALGGRATQIVAGFAHMCALLDSGAVRCWGAGALGYPDGDGAIGDNETPAELPTIDVGSAVTYLTAGGFHTCALLAAGDGRVRCWGHGYTGALGYGNQESVGDDEHPAAAGDVSIGGPVSSLQAYFFSNCALLRSGASRCWGLGDSLLGYRDPQNFGDTEPASSAPALELGGQPREFGGGARCALMSDGSARCWGPNLQGELGYGHTDSVGGDGDLISAGTVQVGGPIAKLAGGVTADHACALLVSGEVRCWGSNDDGQLGLGHQENVGDNELPVDVPAVRVLE